MASFEQSCPNAFRAKIKSAAKNGVNMAFADIPGVVYPKEVVAAAKHPKKIHNTPPKGFIRTSEACKLLHCSAAAVTMRLKRLKVRRVKVMQPGEVPRLFWLESAVLRLAENAPKIVSAIPPGYITADTVMNLLNVCRSSVTRYQQRGMLAAKLVRLQSDLGPRLLYLYKERDVLTFARDMAELHECEQRARSLRNKLKRAA